MVRVINYLKIILILTSLVLGICSCASHSSDGSAEESTTYTPESTAEKKDDGHVAVPDGVEEAKKYADSLVASLPDRKLSSDSFSVASAPGIDLAPHDPADEYEDALIERNSMVENKYGVTIRQIETPLDLMLSDAYSSYLSGTFYANALLIPQSAVGEFSQKGFLISAYSLPHIDYDREYFDRDAMSQASAGYTAPVIAGAATKDNGSYYCMYVNTSLVGEEESSDIFAAVESGDWTWDMLLQSARHLSDVNGGFKTIGTKKAGILADVVYLSSGMHYLNTGWAQIPTMAFETDSTVKLIEIIKNINNAGSAFDDNESDGAELEAFKSGEILFHIDTVGNMPEVSRMGESWCALPVPKVSASQETYCAYCSPEAPVMAVPAGDPATEDSAFVIEALNAASYKYLDRSYYHRLVRTSLNNSKTLDMLEYVYGVNGGKGLYDFTTMYSAAFPQLSYNTTETIWDLAVNGGDLAEAAYNSKYDMNWRFVNAFPMS